MLFLVLFCISCNEIEPQNEVIKEAIAPVQKILASQTAKQLETFQRDSILNHLKAKVKRKEPLVVHLFVPLCDNENQGIVPVSKSLGDGMNLRSNLYWGARYGIKSYFKIDKQWQLLLQEKNIDPNVLERVVFKKIYPNQTTVYMIADAYRGDRMKACLEDFNAAIAGKQEQYLSLDDTKIGIHHHADLIGFNGHNGLMDTSIEPQFNDGKVQKDAVIIACITNDYFIDHLLKARAYPLLLTTNLLAPEAYVIGNVIDAWAKLKNGEEIHLAAAKGYNQYQKCGIRGAKRLFQTGWKKLE